MYFADDPDDLPELNIVLLGYRGAGKSSSGNTILGREEFELKRTAQCVKRQGEVAGRNITVVEAPGWWKNEHVEQSSEILKQEIVLSVSLCPPGPHVLLLVLRVDTTFKDHERSVLEGHMKLLTERVWSHTIVLFTHGDWDCLIDTPIEQHIESEDSALQWLVEKCGNRYHVLNNMNRGDDTQVTELLEKIEEMVAANSGCHFEIDRKILQEVEEKKRVLEERGRERVMKVQKQREDIRELMGDTHHLSDLRIVLLGYRRAGKSSAGNTILGREEFELKRTAQCVKRQAEVAGRMITVVEAPGWWRNEPVEESSEILKQEIVLSVCLCPPGPHVLLLVLRMDTTFKDHERRVLEGHMKLLTERVWSHTIVLFTYGDCLGDTPIEQHIESEDSTLQLLVEKCGNRYHVLNNKNRGDDTQVTELLEKIEEMVAANSGCHFEMDRKILQEVEEKKRVLEERGRERMMEYRRKRLIRPMKGKMRKRLRASFRRSCAESQRDLDVPPVSTVMSLTSDSLMGEPPGFSGESSVSSQSDCPQETNLLMTSVFIPETIDNSEDKNSDIYRFQCPHAGVFQCKITNLVFEMEDKGEVLYGIVSWDTRLMDGLGHMQPAGPLYKIDCFEGSVSHLHLPHCEVTSEDHQVELAVAHFTGDNVEVIKPVKVTDTHVIVAISGFSRFGLIAKMFPVRHISAQVLPFYKPIAGKQNLKQLHIHLLPGNVPVKEVQSESVDFTYIRTSSTCQLIPGRKYRTCCEQYVPQPKVTIFDCDYGPNYHPTFEVFVEVDNVTVSLLDEKDEEVWEPHKLYLTGSACASPLGCSTETPLLSVGAGVAFVNTHREELIQRVSSVMEIADCLQSKNMISDEMYSSIQAARTSQERMRILYQALTSGGRAVKEEFYGILKQKQLVLVQDLESGPSQA
ncbi:uncharacterized protein LOC143488702 [Brachyhypopomus gauderio]|uniref:uncharacterized protein LOC143488702 n=1 Tax=Brachyhypopomus gauderio TaxID=698409 RepID=UPI004040FBB1